MKIFISHSSKDKKIVSALVQLLYAIGLKEKDMFCSSIPELGIPLKKDIFQYLKQEFEQEELYVIFLLSQNYYSSTACVCEMGAAWIRQSEYVSFLCPNFIYEQIAGPINPREIYIKLDDDIEDLKARLGEFKRDIYKKFSIPDSNMTDSRWERVRDSFISSSEVENEIDLSASKTLCIGQLTHAGCVTSRKSPLEVSVMVNFEKTNSDLCSLVIRPTEQNWTRWVSNGRRLTFEIESDLDIRCVNLEFQISSAGENFQTKISLNGKNEILLLDILRKADLWRNVQAICFLFERSNVFKEANFTVKNMRIE